MLNCRQFLGELCDYLDGDQAPEDYAEVQRHLEVCCHCRIVCETTRQTITLYRRTAAIYGLPEGVEARLLAVLDKRIGTPA